MSREFVEIAANERAETAYESAAAANALDALRALQGLAQQESSEAET
jgi:hypothetical protein